MGDKSKGRSLSDVGIPKSAYMSDKKNRSIPDIAASIPLMETEEVRSHVNVSEPGQGLNHRS